MSNVERSTTMLYPMKDSMAEKLITALTWVVLVATVFLALAVILK